MAEFLIKATATAWDIGDFVVIMPDGWSWGSGECLPDFVIVKVPGLDPAASSSWIQQWTMSTNQKLTGGSASTDTWSFSVSSTSYSDESGEGKLTADDITSILNLWGCTNITSSDNLVSFTVAIKDALKTSSYLGINVSGLTLTEVSYTQATGTHRTKIDYSASGWTSDQITTNLSVIQSKGTYVSQNTSAKTITIDIKRTDVQAAFHNYIQLNVVRLIRPRQYKLTAALVQAAINAGGIVTKILSDVQLAAVNKASQ
jgi:hypothetical protein